MYDAVEGKYHALMFRFLADGYTDKEWQFAIDQAEVDSALESMRKGDLDNSMNWRVEVMPFFFRETQIGKMTAHYMGSKTSYAKKVASRENGKKGGRPRKDKPIC